MKTYDKYKNSGFEFIGDIPEHWEAKKLKFLVSEKLKYGANESAELEDLDQPRYIRITDFGEDGTLREYTFKSLPFEIAKHYFLEDGDILFARSGATVGKTFQFKNYDGLACYAGYLIKANPDEDQITSDFLYYFTKSNSYESWKDSIFIQATIQNIGADKYNVLQIPLPTLPEQTAIADYLDEKTEQIDKLMANKGLLIELLKEERTAIINQAVTKGINPNAKLKPSGIDWLGDIPEHWEVKRLKFLSDITTGGRNTEDRIEDGEYPFFVRSQTIERIDTYCFDGEAILTAGDGVGVAKVFHYYNGKLECHQRVYLLSNFREVQGKFLFHYIKSNLYKEVFKLNAKSTVDSLRFPMFQNFVVSFPKDEIEQNEIIEHIESKTNEIDSTISKIKKEIELIKEYRTALISEVVTGKIKVV